LKELFMDSASSYPDPLADALGHGSQRAARIASVVVAAAYGYAQYRARRDRLAAAGDERSARVVADQQRAAYQQARAGWAAALDPRWLGGAGFVQAARAWGAAAPFAGGDPLAASAVRRCEDRLRVLHPYGMARYDRLRAEGAGLIEAMRQAAPLFIRQPYARPGEPPAPRPALGAAASGAGADAARRAAGALSGQPAAGGGRTVAQVVAEGFPHTAAEAATAAVSAGALTRPSSSVVTAQVHRPGRAV
jgi:hypothetical protein